MWRCAEKYRGLDKKIVGSCIFRFGAYLYNADSLFYDRLHNAGERGGTMRVRNIRAKIFFFPRAHLPNLKIIGSTTRFPNWIFFARFHQQRERVPKLLDFELKSWFYLRNYDTTVRDSRMSFRAKDEIRRQQSNDDLHQTTKSNICNCDVAERFNKYLLTKL